MTAGVDVDGGSYSATLLDHFHRPRGAGVVERPDADAESVSAVHGDRLRLTFAIDRGRLTEVRFQCLGCTVAIAAGSVATVLLTGRSVEQALALTDGEVAEALGGVPAERAECSLLVRRTVHAALGRRSA